MKTPVPTDGPSIPVFSPPAGSQHMFRRVVLARGDVPDSNSGYFANHSVVEEVLDKAKVPGWTKAAVVERRAGLSGHSKRVARAPSEAQADLLHITNQWDARLVPSKSTVPVVVSVHDLFDFRPRSIEAGDVAVSLGSRNPSSTLLQSIQEARAGMERADTLLCASEMTLSDAKNLFPRTESVLVRDSVDSELWDPHRKPRPRSLLGDLDDEDKCLVVAVGGEDPRWRSHFLSKVISMLPEETQRDINLIRIGVEKLDMEQISSAYQHAEAMLYPGVSVGFHCPPVEAMASGCPVLASDLPAHAEVLPPECVLPPTDSKEWASSIAAVHGKWRRSGGVTRHAADHLIAHTIATVGRDSQGEALSRAYDDVCAQER